MWWWSTLALAHTCGRHDLDAVLEALVDAEAALREERLDDAVVQADHLRVATVCLDTPMPRMLESRVYRAIGAPRGPDERAPWWSRAVAVEPTWRYGEREVPTVVRDAWAELAEGFEARDPAASRRGRGRTKVEDGIIWCGPPPEKQPLEIGGGIGMAVGIAGQFVAWDKRQRRRPDATAWTVGSTALLVVSAGVTTWGVLIADGPSIGVRVPL